MSESETEDQVNGPPEEEAVAQPEELTSQEPISEEVEEVAEETAEAPPVEEAETEAPEEEMEIVEERIYTIPLRHVWTVTPRGRRAPRSVRDVRNFVARHMKADEVAISDEINNALWARSINKPPRKIRVRAVKDKEGKVIVYPAKAA